MPYEENYIPAALTLWGFAGAEGDAALVRPKVHDSGLDSNTGGMLFLGWVDAQR